MYYDNLHNKELIASPSKANMRNQNNYMVYIPASGRGSRIRELTGDIPKTLLKMGEQTILARLLSAASALPNTHVIISTKPEDVHIGNFLRLNHFSCYIELRKMEPGGYLSDLVRISKETGYDEFTILNSDLVAPLPDLLRFLDEVRKWPQDVPVIMGIIAEPVPYQYNAEDIWLTSKSDSFFTINPTGIRGDFIVANAHHWRPSALREVEDLLSQGPTRFHDYIINLAYQARLVGGIQFSQAHNINTPDLLARAQSDVLEWQRSSKDTLLISDISARLK
jgi:NDP-sugar pyrophosphorylase family protein